MKKLINQVKLHMTVCNKILFRKSTDKYILLTEFLEPYNYNLRNINYIYAIK